MINQFASNQIKQILIAAAMLLSFFSGATLSAMSDDVRILDASDQGITLELSPLIERIDTLRINQDIFLSIRLSNGSISGDPGYPAIPTRVVNVGIPLEAEVTVKIIGVETQAFEGKLLPIPFIDQAANYHYHPQPEVYQSTQLFPQQIITFDQSGFIRDQRVVTIRLAPLQLQGGANRILFHHRIIIRVDFNGSTEGIGSRLDARRDEEFYRGVVINFPQSRKWLKRHLPQLKRAKPVFPAENLYKITIKQDGLYKISGDDLAKQGVNISAIQPETIKIFNNGGRELPQSLKEWRPDSLIEHAIRVVDLNGNGKFDKDDYILFYGKAVNGWDRLDSKPSFYQHYINHYTTENIYWLNWGNRLGKRMAMKPSVALAGATPAPYFTGRFFNEDESVNYLKSGINWFGRQMLGQSAQQSYSVFLPDPATSENNVYFKIQLLGITPGNHSFSVTLNNQLLGNFSFYGSYTLRAFEAQATVPLAANGVNTLKITYNGSAAESQSYVDWFEIQYKRQFIARDNSLMFNQVGEAPQLYQISNFKNNQIEVYDITDPFNVQMIADAVIGSGTITFGDASTGLPRRDYFAATPEAWLQPTRIQPVTSANLRNSVEGADFIIITHDDFYDAVLPLKYHRETFDSLKTFVVRITDVYHEFSWGLFDPIAIRDFIKYAYDNWTPSPRYVLLCGDGDYDYKNIKSNLDRNWIPTYQTAELDENSNRTMDEFFVLVSGDDNHPDLAIGRFPVQSVEETQNVVEKILRYETLPYWQPDQEIPVEDWRNIVTMVADDEYHNSQSQNEVMHTRDAETIMEVTIPKSLNKEKIYLIEYPAIREPAFSGFRKPAATAALLDRLNKGTLIVNYVGHGAPTIWADERVLLDNRDVDLIQNDDKLPLWVAATCDFGRFDDPMERGTAEKLFVTKRRGGIAFMTSARLAYASDNTELNKRFYQQLFSNPYGPTERLGVALIRAKINNFSTINDQKYHLYGDPTMRLAKPILIGNIASMQPDTLKALSEIIIRGQATTGKPGAQKFSGKALLKIFDSQSIKIYQTPFGSQIPYIAPGRTIFRGIVNVNQGELAARFMVPKDISYGGTNGRISIYFANEQQHGAAYRENIPVGGTSALRDIEGPIIKIRVAGGLLSDGSYIPQDAILEIEIADSVSGVNIAGDIGHHITMVIDDRDDNEIILTDQFNYYEDNFKAGKIRYPLTSYKSNSYDSNNNLIQHVGLEPGEHKVRVKAWDNFNNSSVASIGFTVISNDQLKISNVYNYPNPFTTGTTFLFSLSHPSQCRIRIYTIAGRLIQTISDLSCDAGLNQVFWDGHDRDGDPLANGVYLYQIAATARTGERILKDEFVGKLVIAR
ncbi:MAG: type IX secretion system sortase PorU [candidate division KSB1 bacterium]|nr:type IX secretion system sortase PorU [candidate division KSB1 bacterium]MDZ7333595.1 type IX secretion system sortase PorU [candidate division KSB1 bacterium]MDZ7357831.1 type IX secretion system sortase PorU [candidate division KSB1 bacterium]MDZ7398709.1 type IX secretion system sortase PorU [candidate division KSB1 bacterium]